MILWLIYVYLLFWALFMLYEDKGKNIALTALFYICIVAAGVEYIIAYLHYKWWLLLIFAININLIVKFFSSVFESFVAEKILNRRFYRLLRV